MQFVLYVLGPFLLCVGLAVGAVMAGLGYYRDKRCTKREVAIGNHAKWVQEVNAALGSVLYGIYNNADLEAVYGRPLVRQLERLVETAPTTKELS